MRAKPWIFLLVLCLLLTSCNLPVAQTTPATEAPAAPGVDVVATAVELTTVAKLTEIAAALPTATETPSAPPTETPSPPPPAASPTVCVPSATANTTANIRSGPGTVYEVVGNLTQGQAATVAGRNEANNWWYIEFAAATGGHAWISSSVATTACLPASVAVVAAPPTPQPTATTKVSQPSAGSGAADLVASGMQWSPDPGKKKEPFYIEVKVTNQGEGAAGPFTVVWLSNQDEVGCTWTLSGLAAGASKNFECQHVYSNNPGATSTYWITLKVDSANEVAETDEGNNTRAVQVKVQP